MSPRDTDQDWSAIAETQPYWAVLSHDDFRGELDAAARESFFASGERQVAGLLGFIKKHLLADFEPDRVLDFGCGVGRLLIPLAQRASEVVGVDIAPRMIELCRANLLENKLFNATVISGDDTLSRVNGRFNLVNSLIVLQHIPPERGYRLIARLMDLIEVGGVGSFQVTYAKERRFMVHEAPRARYFRRNGTVLQDLSAVDESADGVGTIRMYDYDLNQVMLMIAEISGHPVLALPSHDDGHAGYHFVFLRAR